MHNLWKKTFENKEKRGHQFIYVLVDLHDTIISGVYRRDNKGYTIFPDAAEVLEYLYSRPDFRLILWTSSHQDAIACICSELAMKGIRFHAINKNRWEHNTELCDFRKKPYFSIGIDDKFGFSGDTGWTEIKNILIQLGEWKRE